MTMDKSPKVLMREARQANLDGEFRESHFHDLICCILDEAGVDYEREHPFSITEEDRSTRYCDIYIPATDTAMELKLEANMRGLGQCMFYKRFCRESLLVVNAEPKANYDKNVHAAVEAAPGIGFAMCRPGAHKNPPILEMQSQSQSNFFWEATHGNLGDYDFLCQTHLNPAGHVEY